LNNLEVMKQRNLFIIKATWLFFAIDIPINLLQGNFATVKVLIVVAIPALVLMTYLVKKNTSARLVMDLDLILILAVLFILNIKAANVVNLFFLILPPIISVLYRNWKYIFITTMISAAAFSYFLLLHGASYFTDWEATDVIYFLLFFLLYAVLNIYESKYSEKAEALIQKQEQILKESETKYRLIADNMYDFVTVLAPDGKILYASPSHENVMKMNPSELEGTYSHAYIHPDDLDSFLSKFHSMIETGTNLKADIRWKVGAEWIFLAMRGKPVVEKNGKIQKVVMVSRNITERIKMEQKIKQTSARLEALISHLPYGILALDKNNQVLLVNQKLREIFTNSSFSQEIIGIKPIEGSAQGKNIFLEGDLYEKRNREILEHCETVLDEEWKLKDGRIISRDAIPIFVNDQLDGFLWQFKDITKQKKLEKHLQEASLMDGLTKIHNRRYFDETLIREWRRCARTSQPLTLIMLDIDDFKKYNDTYGHLQGDASIILVAQTVQETLKRPADVACRYGGEEFAVILPETHQEGGMKIAEKIRSAIERLEIPHATSSVSTVLTCSLGVATIIPIPSIDFKELIGMADKALYVSKTKGKNCVNAFK
jgi:diguanylate cyclase (GGDEF)-like protein/PAS domain S-box-containing protein